jgi:hypothetical protein
MINSILQNKKNPAHRAGFLMQRKKVFTFFIRTLPAAATSAAAATAVAASVTAAAAATATIFSAGTRFVDR